jgi:hypothetical protein
MTRGIGFVPRFDLDLERKSFFDFIRKKRRNGVLSQDTYEAVRAEFGKVAAAAGTDLSPEDDVIDGLVSHGLSNAKNKLQECDPRIYAEFIAYNQNKRSR